jgi:hypothetical protein
LKNGTHRDGNFSSYPGHVSDNVTERFHAGVVGQQHEVQRQLVGMAQNALGAALQHFLSKFMGQCFFYTLNGEKNYSENRFL